MIYSFLDDFNTYKEYGGLMNCDLSNIMKHFNISDSVVPFGDGLINDTFCTDDGKYLVQRINTAVFNDLDGLMHNIELVTEHLKTKIIAENGNPERQTLTIVKTDDDKSYFKADKKYAYRVYKFISGAKTINSGATSKEMFNAGKCLGDFVRMLDDFPVNNLNETIKDFHNTPKRIEDLKTAVKEDKCGRVKTAVDEIDFALAGFPFADIVSSALKNGEIPLRVTHNDTKLNNILFDDITDEGLCVIDLDTVMPGSLLYDYSDALRTGAAKAKEDEENLNKVAFDISLFSEFTRGYLISVKDIITKKELELMPISVMLMPYECGIRFLTDYLSGDIYFKTNGENHNLFRARNQFKMVKDIISKQNVIEDIISKYALCEGK